MLRHRMFKKQLGFILFYTLILLMLIIFISTYTLQNALQEIKMSQSLWLHQNHFILTKQLLSRLEKKLQIDIPSCMTSHAVTSDLLRQSSEWWQLNSCQGELSEVKYNYVVENIINDACGEVIGQNELGARFFRITLLSFSKKNQEKLVLQSTTVKSDNALGQCNGVHHKINLGRQSWDQYEY